MQPEVLTLARLALTLTLTLTLTLDIMRTRAHRIPSSLLNNVPNVSLALCLRHHATLTFTLLRSSPPGGPAASLAPREIQTYTNMPLTRSTAVPIFIGAQSGARLHRLRFTVCESPHLSTLLHYANTPAPYPRARIDACLISGHPQTSSVLPTPWPPSPPSGGVGVTGHGPSLWGQGYGPTLPRRLFYSRRWSPPRPLV